MPPPPPSTLFPYTTLFRSAAKLIVGQRRDRGLEGIHLDHDWTQTFEFPVVLGAIVVEVNTFEPAITDRKSTRLNSSHPSISYAVFCLKKKKTSISTSTATP